MNSARSLNLRTFEASESRAAQRKVEFSGKSGPGRQDRNISVSAHSTHHHYTCGRSKHPYVPDADVNI